MKHETEQYSSNYPKVPYYKDSYARRLSRMSRADRLLAKAIRRTLDSPKSKYNKFGQDFYDIGNGKTVNHLPREWR